MATPGPWLSVFPALPLMQWDVLRRLARIEGPSLSMYTRGRSGTALQVFVVVLRSVSEQRRCSSACPASARGRQRPRRSGVSPL
jgi:hypothetical protein